MTDVKITSKNGAVLKTAGKYCQDDIDISLKDADKLIPENIKEGVSILGVTGTLMDDLYVQYFNHTLTTGMIPEGSTKIPDYAFYGQGTMTSVIVPSSVTYIGDYAFRSCSNLKSIVIPDGVTSIGVGAFYSCTSLTTITILDSVTSIYQNAFERCLNLSSINISESGSNLTIRSYAFNSCCNIIAIKLPKRVVSVGGYVFWSCTNLTQVVIENPSLNMYTSSNGKAGIWYLCKKLANIQIPQGFTSSMDLYSQTINKIPQGVPLTKECLHQIITNYADMTGKTSPILYVYPNNVENITDEDRELAQSKNITIKLIES